MEKTIALIIVLCSSIFTPLSANPCKPDSCDAVSGAIIRFPFRLRNRNPTRCVHPGFDLYCNTLNQTILNLPKSGEFVVDHIDYAAQALFINDPDSCLPGRILNFSLSGSPFRGAYTRNYTFLNCSSDYLDYTSTRYYYMPLFCLSGRNYTVLATNTRPAAEVPPTCRKIGSVLVPLQWTLAQFYWSAMGFAGGSSACLESTRFGAAFAGIRMIRAPKLFATGLLNPVFQEAPNTAS